MLIGPVGDLSSRAAALQDFQALLRFGSDDCRHPHMSFQPRERCRHPLASIHVTAHQYAAGGQSEVAHEQSRSRAEGRRDGNHERYREPKCVRAGDHQNRHQAFDGECARRAQRRPYDERDCAGSDGNDCQDECGPVGQCLST